MNSDLYSLRWIKNLAEDESENQKSTSKTAIKTFLLHQTNKDVGLDMIDKVINNNPYSYTY